MIRVSHSIGLILLCAAQLPAQTTQGMITGRVFDQKTGRVIPRAKIECRSEQTGQPTTAYSGADGYYSLLRLSPGIYSIRATKAQVVTSGTAYQAREAYEMEVFVAGRVVLDIPLRQLADTYSQSVYRDSYLPSSDSIVHVYAADLATTYSQPLSVLLGSSGSLFSTLSYVVDPRQVRDLPLAGRDIYTMLVALPGVTADNATARGLGLSVNGQRSSSSNFLLDGVENNDYLLTGPLTVIAPEAVEEYRVSTNNYSAEFGRTGGFVANAVTRAGGKDYHGIVYGYLNDTLLDANSYQHIAGLNTSTFERGRSSVPRQRHTDVHAGFWIGGPLIKKGLFWSAAYERFRSRGEADVFPFQVPVLQRIQQCPGGKAVAVSFLSRFQPPVPAGLSSVPFTCDTLSVPYNSPLQPLEFNRSLGLGRMDWLKSESQRLIGRVAISRFDQPDFIYSIYPGFSSTLNVNSSGLALAYLWLPTPTINNELRLGVRNQAQGWDRPRADIPQLLTSVDNGAQYQFISLPGSTASYAFDYRMHSGELSDSLTIAKGAHIMSLGAGVLINRSESALTFRQDGLYFFPSIQKFAQDAPNALVISVARAGPQGLPEVTQTPDYGRSYANNQFYGFFQDSIKLSRTVGINVGLRYESFGAVKNTGVQDGYFQLADGTAIDQQLAGASLIYDQSHQRSLYRPDRSNWAPRFGIYYDLLGRGRTVFRGAFGAFYDRPFDNLTISTRNNNLELVNLSPPPVYPQPARVTSVGTRVTPTPVPELLWVDQNLRTPYVQSWFAGLQHQFSRDLYFEASAQGALGRKLIGTDIVNRRAVNAQGNEGRLNEKIAEDIVFRSNAVASNYTALTALTRYRSRQAQFQLAYTWGHSIDNQSDPLQGTFDDLQPSRSSNVSQGDNRAAFTRQFQSGTDRASSDFDQRHNVIVFFIWDISPALRSRMGKLALEHWQVSGITGYRSGFPFNLITSDLLPACPIAGGAVSSTELIRNRPGLLPGRSPFLDHRIAVPGGYQLLDPTAFCASSPGVVGNIGRNALTGPGFCNADLSIAKSFHPRVLGESGRLQFRADFFNAFNHANLGSPEGLASVGPGSTFGQALLGRQGVQPSFPSAAPLDQLARQVQLQLKIIF